MSLISMGLKGIRRGRQSTNFIFGTEIRFKGSYYIKLRVWRRFPHKS